MIFNYLTVAFRNLRRYSGYTLINVLGLIVALTCALQIMAYVRHQFQYNVHVDPEERIFRLMHLQPADDDEAFWTAVTRGPFASAIDTEIPGVEKAFKSMTRPIWISHQEQSRQAMTCIADTAYIDYFALAAVEGDAREILRRPASAMITKSFSKQLFGDADPVGQTVTIDYKWGLKGDWIIHGILQDPPNTTTSRLAFEFITVSRPKEMNRLWNHRIHRPFWSWIVLEEGVTPKDVEPKLEPILRRLMPAENADRSALRLQPVHQIHLYTKSDYGIRGANGDINELLIFASACVLLLLIAAANFVNLTIAQATARNLEIGVRKAIGATRGQLTIQFLIESLLLTFFAAGVTFAVFHPICGFVSAYLGIQIPSSGGWIVLGDLTVLTLILSILSCSYPAAHLSALRPIEALAKVSPQGSGLTGRKGLIVFQFTVSAVLIMASIAMSRQMNLIEEKDLGFDKELLVTLPLFRADPTLNGRSSVVRQTFERHPGVISASGSGMPIGVNDRINGLTVSPENQRNEGIEMDRILVDDGFIETYGLTLFDGSNFGQGSQCILNEKAARLLGYYADSGEELKSPVGKQVWTGNWLGLREIVGVVRDFQHGSLHRAVAPLIMTNWPEYGFLTVRIMPNRISETLIHLKRTWERFVPGKPFQYEFLSDRYSGFYLDERIVHRGLTLAAGLTIFTACLGVLGLAAFVVRIRVKEVAIRRVFGASEASIYVLLSSNFARLVAVANLIAIPVAWYGLNRWLDNFVYRITLDPSIFLIGVFSGLFLALAAVAWQARSAVQMNPTDALRNE